MERLIQLGKQIIAPLDSVGDWVALLAIRLLMAYEFTNAGLRKFNASDSWYADVPNWFANTAAGFPFPISMFSIEFNWFAVTWIEILGGMSLLLGLFTRFWALSLIIVSIVAISGAHMPDEWSGLAELWKGYAVSDKGFGNFRIPLLFIAMLMPLLFKGAGKLSIDSLLVRKTS